jgi:hypothetical protein
MMPMQTGLIVAIIIGMVWGAARHHEHPPVEVDE